MLKESSSLDEIVSSNLGLVYSCANKFKGRGIEFDDLYQAGCLGLVKAAKNFDDSLGFAFSTYAVPVILGEIKRLFRDGGSIKIGRALKEKSRIAMLKKEEITVSLGREPTIGELSQELGTDPTETAMLLNASSPVVSLTGGEEGEYQFDLPVESHESKVSDSIALKQVLSSLNEKDRMLIHLRFYRGMTQSATANVLGMTQVQVSRKEKTILESIRNKLNI
ncbi:MAG: sigma-70 family RNA polymerase sigma factor [Clostridia bacterium]|nr:sigma-70 family RNA polymerase sigma factor [Clostridia bacterium]